MGSGAARHRASRRQAAQAASTTSQFANQASPHRAPSFNHVFYHGPYQSLTYEQQSFIPNPEDRRTSRSSWKESSRLRDNAVQFVSGGKLTQDMPDNDDNKNDHPKEQQQFTSEQKEDMAPSRQDEIWQQRRLQTENVTVGIPSVGLEIPITERVEHLKLSAENRDSSSSRRRANSASSTSSSEVILFAGRGYPQIKRKQPPRSIRRSGNAPCSEPTHTDKAFSTHQSPSPNHAPSRLKADATEFVPRQTTTPGSKYSLRSQGVVASLDWGQDVNTVNHEEKHDSNGHLGKFNRTLSDTYNTDEEEILRDYIENVRGTQESGEEDIPSENEHCSSNRGSAVENGEVKAVGWASQVEIHSTGPENDWNSDDLRDFDELDTSEDELSDIGDVYSRRERPSGLQYLVSPRGKSTDFAKWILEEKLTSVRVKGLIIAFEETRPGGPDGDGPDEVEDDRDDSLDDGMSEEALDDLIRDQESEHNENERILDQTSRMTDADLARILNKQEELGISAADVVLFDDAFERNEDYVSTSTKVYSSKRTRTRQNRRSRGTFPSAEAFADVLDEDPYNGFDVMDFDRPSLKSKRKGRNLVKGLPFELEDDELAESLARSWTNDRAKKAIKKAEREELRQAGLLGPKSKKGRVDLQTKCRDDNMDMEQVKAEVKLFLLDDDRESLALAPMSTSQRAQLHILAKALYLKSHSQGKGDLRFPILTKTEFSGQYDEGSISQIDALLAQRRFSRPWGVKRGKQAATGVPSGRARRGGGGGVAAGVTYMDGDVVGASAPELGSENRGRAMLEKMGWSSGMGIGKVGNKGSVEVIKHVVKNSKAGLG